MSFETISIVKKLPVVNGFVVVPNTDNSKLTSVTPAEAEILIAGSDEQKEFYINVKSRGCQNYRTQLEFPAFNSQTIYPDDWYQTLKDATE